MGSARRGRAAREGREPDVDRWLALLRDGRDKDDVYAAMQWLAEIGTRAEERLLAVLGDRAEPEIFRARAMDTLSMLGSTRAGDALIALLGDPSVELRWHAAVALGKLGDERALHALERAAARDAGEMAPMPGFVLRVRDAAREAIERIRARA